MEGNLYKNKYRIKSCRYDGWDYSNDGYYFITICTKDRELFFGDVIGGKMILNEYGKIIKDEWKKSEKIRKEIILDYFVVMPNHLHAVVGINNDAVETNGRLPAGMNDRFHVETNGRSSVGMNGRLPAGMNDRFHVETNGRSSLRYKNNFRMEKKSISSLMAGFKSITTKIINERRNQPGEKIWQNNYYDRIIRDENELNRIRQYIIDNPYKWGLDRNNPKNF